MDRRQALKAAIASLVAAMPAYAQPQWIHNAHVLQFGASVPRRVRRDRKSFHRVFRPFKGVSGAIEKDVLLYQNLQKELGEIIPHNQSDIRHDDGRVESGEGDCIGPAASMGADLLAATNIHMLGMQERFVAKASVEMTYAGSRIEVGRDGRPQDNPKKQNYLEGRAGSHGEWVAHYLQQYGVLHRKQYSDGPKISAELRLQERPRRSGVL